MKKLISALAIVLSCVVLPSQALAAPAQRVPAWNMTGDYTISFGCGSCVPHFIRITSSDVLAGAFAGSGFYTLNPAFTWTVSGTVSGNQVAMHILYTGADAGYFVDLSGTITPDGSLSGSATDSSHDLFSWLASGRAIAYINHGDFVSSQLNNKQAAAQSIFGKPDLAWANRSPAASVQEK